MFWTHVSMKHIFLSITKKTNDHEAQPWGGPKADKNGGVGAETPLTFILMNSRLTVRRPLSAWGTQHKKHVNLFCGFQFCFAFNLWLRIISREPDLQSSTMHCFKSEAKDAEELTIVKWQTLHHNHGTGPRQKYTTADEQHIVDLRHTTRHNYTWQREMPLRQQTKFKSFPHPPHAFTWHMLRS